jgi:glycerophosphocholine phosphodiesterase GPCPD1
MIIKIQTFEPENVAYHIDFYLVEETTPLRKHIGFAYVLPIHSNLELADNKHLNRMVPIIGLKHNPFVFIFFFQIIRKNFFVLFVFSIGQIKIDVLLITPLEGVQQKFFVTPSKYWREGRRPVNVGHRGLGKTNTEHIPAKQQSTDSIKQRTNDSSTPSFPSTTRPVQTKFVSENTLASFKGAFQLGFDFVEFDVQLSKDKIPVVYHDFQVAITLKRKGQEAELFVVPVKDLTLPQLQSLKIYHASKTDVTKVDEELDEDDQTNTNNNLTSPTITTFIPSVNPSGGQQQDEKKFRSLFPTLQELFEKLDPHLGFNVEIKYAMEYRHGGSEQNHYFERNEYIDCILRCLITYGK